MHESYERDFKGIWIPKEIWLNNDLTIMEKLFLVEIDSLDSSEKHCYASNKYFSDFFQLSKGRCTQVIKSLEEKKLINITYIRDGKEIKERIIEVVRIINTPIEYINYPVNFLNYPGKFSKSPYLENDEENNTSLNNTYINNTYKEKINKKEIRHKYGEYKNVLLTDSQYSKLVDDYGDSKLSEMIKNLDEGIQMKGYKYKDHNLVLRKWESNSQTKPKYQNYSNNRSNFYGEQNFELKVNYE